MSAMLDAVEQANRALRAWYGWHAPDARKGWQNQIALFVHRDGEQYVATVKVWIAAFGEENSHRFTGATWGEAISSAVAGMKSL